MIFYYFVICYLVTYYNSKTVFHTVNVLDLDGNFCPLPTRRNMACPKLCVQNLDQCPPKLKPNCGDGMAYCGDGKCYKDKCPETVANPCNCGQSVDLGVVPCNITLITLVEVKNYKKVDEPQLLGGECAKQLEYQGEWSVYNGEKLDKPFWLQCPRSTDPVFSYNETIWKAVFGYVGVQVGILIIWQIYKFISEMGSRDMFACENSPPTSESFDSRNRNNSSYVMETEKTFRSKYLHLMESNELFPISGYKNHIFGTLGFYTLCLTTIMFWVFIFINVLDYYGDITGTPFGVYKNSWALSSKTMMSVWICTAVWLIGLNIVKTRVRNYFRVKVNPLIADYIEIKKPEHPSILSENQTTRLVKLVQALENMAKKLIGWDKLITTERLYRTQTGRFYFTYQCTRLIYQEKLGFFAPHQFQLGDSYEDFYPLINGITVEEANRRLELKGPNFISVKVDNLPLALAKELMGFFYAYQFMLFTILFYIDYYIMAFVITSVIVFSAFVKVITKRSSELRVKGMAEQTSQVKVLRDGRWLEYSSDQLIPGDVIAILDKEVLRCDCVLLSGKAVMDESSLTGEPLPIRKFPLPTDHTNFDATSHSKMHTLFDGTKTVQVVPDPGELYVKALVLETCTSTDKGRLIQKILYSQPITFIFDEELKVAIVFLVLWGFFIFGFGVWFMSQELAVAWFYSVFAIAGVINPLLPAALVIGQSVAAKRLRDCKIFCVDYPRIIIAGKVELFCFDKTGTLTKDGLDYLGGQPTILTGGGVKLGEMTDDITKYPMEFEMGLASCHSVASVNGMMVGNPVDIEMFKYVDWNLELPEQVTYLDTIRSKTGKKIHVVQRFQFVHARASMSVAILDPNTGHVHVYVKGSFEKLKELCKSTTFPVNYDEQTEGLATRGCYVLGLGHKDLGVVPIDKVKEMTRDELESNIDLIGLIVFSNQLKPDSKNAILELKAGSIRTVMITGDTALTGIYIAKESNMMNYQARVFLGDINKFGNDVEWKDLDDPTRTRLYTTEEVTFQMRSTHTGERPIELAVTGKAFNYLIGKQMLYDLLLHIRVFARMTPADKVRCVELHMERGITAMCGDGGNDCGALRVAHVGLALSDAEASIVSPFSSSNRSINSCVELIKQGRCALATSFSNYKYLIMRGEITAILRFVTLYYNTTYSQGTWIFFDAVMTILLTYTITQSKPAPILSKYRPTARLLGFETLGSTMGVIMLNIIFCISVLAYLNYQPFHACNEFDSSVVDMFKWKQLGDNYESEVLAFLAMFQFMAISFTYNLGSLHRETWWKNKLHNFFWLTIIIFISCILLTDPNNLGCLMRINCGDKTFIEKLGYALPTIDYPAWNHPQGHNIMPRYFRWGLWALCMSNMVSAIIWESQVILGPGRKWFRARYGKKSKNIQY